MRKRIVLATLGLGTLCVLGLTLLSPKSRTSSADPTVALAVVRPPESQTPGKPDPAVALGADSPVGEKQSVPRGQGWPRSEGRDEAYVEARTEELRSLSGKSDAATLEVLLSEVKNPDSEIRQAALDAIIQSGNRGAIPRLEQFVGEIEDTAAKQAIVETIEFLKLPSLTEILRRLNQAPGH